MAENKSLAKNSIYYLIYNVLNILFPFLIGIYVARILTPDSIGAVTFAQNIMQYFVIFAFLGIPTYGMREIAKARDDKNALNKLFTELFIINFISTLFFICLYVGMIFIVPTFRNNIWLYLVVGLLLVLNAINITWLFEGLEEFRFISLRNVIFKAVSFVFLIIFVKSDDDLLLYACINVIGTAGNYIINIIYYRRFAHFTFKNLNFKKHLRPIFALVVVNLAIEIYTLIDVTMLGIFCQNENVTYYSYASKIQKIFLSVINTFTMVLVPRISLYYKEGNYEEFNNLLSKTLQLILLLAVPMIVGTILLSDNAITLLYGDDYIASSSVLKVLSFLLVISPVGYLLGSRVCLVAGQEWKMVVSVSVGAIVNVICNIFFIQLYQELGAAIASVISEIVVAIIYICFGKKYFKLHLKWWSLISVVIASTTMAVGLYFSDFIPINIYLKLILQIICAVILYFAILLVLHENIVYTTCRNIMKKVFKK